MQYQVEDSFSISDSSPVMLTSAIECKKLVATKRVLFLDNINSFTNFSYFSSI